MDLRKQQLEQKLIANVIVDKCACNRDLIFRDAWCSQERVIRFTTPFFRSLFSVEEKDVGRWRTGDYVMYEAVNDPGQFTVDCVLDCRAHPGVTALLRACGLPRTQDGKPVILHSRNLSAGAKSANDLFAAFDRYLSETLPAFEDAVTKRLRDAEEATLKEGAAEEAASRKYERNPKARAACLAAHGAVCAVCGMDFGKVYGPEFAGKIEVHHIVPLSEIGREYVVDPVRDLIPVCPNCHTALHSKKGGVYTVEELKTFRNSSQETPPE